MKDEMLIRILNGIQREGEKMDLTYEQIVRLKARVLAVTAVEEEKEMQDAADRG